MQSKSPFSNENGDFDSGLEDWERVEFLSEYDFAIATNPVIEGCGIHFTEVDLKPNVAILQVGKVRLAAMDSALNFATDEEHRSGGAVVGTLAGVLGGPSSELGEDQHDDLVALADRFHFSLERENGVRKVSEQLGVCVDLSGVGIKTTSREVNDSGRWRCANELRDLLEALTKCVVSICLLRRELAELLAEYAHRIERRLVGLLNHSGWAAAHGVHSLYVAEQLLGVRVAQHVLDIGQRGKTGDAGTLTHQGERLFGRETQRHDWVWRLILHRDIEVPTDPAMLHSPGHRYSSGKRWCKRP